MFTFRTLPARLMFADDPAEGGGGSDPTGDPAPTGDGDPDPDEGDEPDDGADLGDKGKQALDRMKAERAAAKKEAREAKAEAEAMRAKLEGKEAEHAAEIEKQKIKDEALAAANARILKAEIRAAAAGKLADPADALRFL